jgi:hypothetical protein
MKVVVFLGERKLGAGHESHYINVLFYTEHFLLMPNIVCWLTRF